jgi:hypothetical protein
MGKVHSLYLNLSQTQRENTYMSDDLTPCTIAELDHKRALHTVLFVIVRWRFDRKILYLLLQPPSVFKVRGDLFI